MKAFSTSGACIEDRTAKRFPYPGSTVGREVLNSSLRVIFLLKGSKMHVINGLDKGLGYRKGPSLLLDETWNFVSLSQLFPGLKLSEHTDRQIAEVVRIQ